MVIASVTYDLFQGLLKALVGAYQVDDTRVVSGARIADKLLQNDIEWLRMMIVTSDVLGGCVKTVTDGYDVDDWETIRFEVVKRSWIAITIIPLVVAECNLLVVVQGFVDIKEW